jgi:hypothetical protein
LGDFRKISVGLLNYSNIISIFAPQAEKLQCRCDLSAFLFYPKLVCCQGLFNPSAFQLFTEFILLGIFLEGARPPRFSVSPHLAIATS